jgi:hypothetical protein
MMLLPPPKDKCPICATKHDPSWPHNAQSMYYQYRFYGIRGRWPTWADAMAHCSDQMRADWKGELLKRGHWSEPDGEPIADPPEESVNQPIGDINTRGFGPAYDPSLV